MTDFRYMMQATDQAVEYSVIRHEAQIFQTVADLTSKLGVHRLGLESRHVSLQQSGQLQAALGSLEYVQTEDVIERLRDVKDEEEIRTISEAARITDAAFTEVLNYIQPGVTERRIAAELEYQLRLAGAESGGLRSLSLQVSVRRCRTGWPVTRKLVRTSSSQWILAQMCVVIYPISRVPYS